jgi:hypothetical protein
MERDVECRQVFACHWVASVPELEGGEFHLSSACGVRCARAESACGRVHRRTKAWQKWCADKSRRVSRREAW